MSRIGLKVVNLPAGVTVIQEGDVLTVKGPRGVDTVKVPHLIHAHIDEHDVRFTRENDMKATKQLHGTTRANFHNAVVGVTQGYKKELELVGIGYRAQMRGKDLVLFVGYSHEVVITPEEGVVITTKSPTEITVEGNDKQAVGQTAARIHRTREPEPYNGKGVLYKGEHIIRKEGKRAGK